MTEGIAGTENQCIGVAEALGLQPVVKRVHLRFPWKQLSPWLSFGHQYALAAESDPVDPPYPDLLIASGRKSVGLALHVKKMSGGRTFLVQLQDPHIDPKRFDLVVAPQHDRLQGDNVLVTAGALHRVTPEKIAAEQKKFEPVLGRLPQPRVAVLIGGASKTHIMTREDAQRLAQQLKSLDAGLMITASRRTGEENLRLLRDALKGEHVFFWDGAGDNPYFAMLGFADHIIVTEDSVSMVSEAVSTGKPVYIAPLSGGSEKFALFHQAFAEKGYTRPFTGSLETWSYIPPNDTLRVAEEVLRRMKLKG
ncbi:MAG: mitochondrial fission ELM1 family protein [Alphaproteobacteria bacterium]|nr:mitochondrial fission ELM1 family protein [Alphaproteobacteria bacterium]